MLDKITNSWRSATIWFNGIVLAALPFAGQISQGISDNLPLVFPYIGGNILKYLAIFILVANIALRFKTTQPLESK